MARPSLLPAPSFEATSQPSCLACLDLDYNQFDGIPVRPDKLRTHHSKLGNIRSAAREGCTTCDILLQGMALFPLNAIDSDDQNGRAQSEQDVEPDSWIIRFYSIPGKPLQVGADRIRYEHHMRLDFYTEPGVSILLHVSQM